MLAYLFVNLQHNLDSFNSILDHGTLSRLTTTASTKTITTADSIDETVASAYIVAGREGKRGNGG
jgi:hypothetical protein